MVKIKSVDNKFEFILDNLVGANKISSYALFGGIYQITLKNGEFHYLKAANDLGVNIAKVTKLVNQN